MNSTTGPTAAGLPAEAKRITFHSGSGFLFCDATLWRTQGNRFLRVALPALLAVVLVGAHGAVHAQDKYPNHPIRLIVPFAAGGPGDIVARAFTGPMSDDLGESVYVDDRPGGDTALGTELAAKAAPDGYTILQVATAQTINMVLKPKVNYDLLRDFAPVARTVQSSMVLVTSNTSKLRSVPDLVAYAKAHPNTATYGSGSIGTVGHLSAELFKRTAGFTALHVPYKGTGVALSDLIAGRLDFFFMTQSEAFGNVQGGLLRALAVTSAQPMASFPNAPTMTELGYKGFDAKVSYGYMVPVGTPPAIVQRLQEAILKSLNSPSTQKTILAQGLTQVPRGPNELAATIKSDLAVWGTVIKAANIKAE